MKLTSPDHAWRHLAAIKILLLVAFALAPVSLLAQNGFASLEEQMTGAEFESAGLDKLSAEELASLNNWIRAHSLATLDASRYQPTGPGAEERPPGIEEMEREPIVTRINGTFSGWDGHTVFKLENGMIWAQVDKDKFYTRELRNPTVIIEPAMFGAWKLKVEGFDEDCRVERLE